MAYDMVVDRNIIRRFFHLLLLEIEARNLARRTQ